MKDIERLLDLVGKEFDVDDVICCFIDNEYEQVIVEEIEGYTSNFEGHGVCQLWNGYYNTKDSEVYKIWVNDNNEIVEVR